MTPVERAWLVRQGISGHHIHGLLPGNDPKNAISEICAGGGGFTWSESDPHQWGHVSRKGIGLYPTVQEANDDKNASEMIRWSEVLSIIATGSAGGLREAYEAAYGEFCAWARAGGYQLTGEGSHEEYSRVSHGINATTSAIIIAGCVPAQLEMFV